MTNNTNLIDKLKSHNNNGVVNGNNPPKNKVFDLIKSMESQIKMALPKHITPERMLRIVLTAIKSNEKLANCDTNSLLGAIMLSIQLGLEPNTPLGQAYLIPRFNTKKGICEVQFQIGYKGILELSYRSKEFSNIYAMEVYQEDEFKFNYGLNPDLIHVPAAMQTGEPIYYYAVYKLKEGGFDFRVWSRKKVLKHSQKYSQAVQKGWTSPWETDFDSMAKKTVLKDLLKYSPKSIELSRVVTNDEETLRAEFDKDSVDIVPTYQRTEEIEQQEEPAIEEPKQEVKKEHKQQQTKEDVDDNMIDDETENLELKEANIIPPVRETTSKAPTLFNNGNGKKEAPPRGVL